MTNIVLRQTCSVYHDAAGTQLYRIVDEIIGAEGPPLELFVFRVETDVYDHVASFTDLQDYPADLNEARNQSLDFYRCETVTRDFTTVSEAVHFAEVVRSSLASLRVVFDEITVEFVGVQEYTFSAE